VRVGIGYDVHPLVEGRPLIVGGVDVPFDRGLDGHSDGDVLAHAVIDAILGAAALGDIGQHFSSDNDELRGISSMDLVRRSVTLVAEAGFGVSNIDATVIAEAPMLAPHISQMRELLADALTVDLSNVSVKATTTDRLGSIGRGEGIAAVAVALIDSTYSIEA
jgi:2-C-methyl-D-erythritol 2,4-cyclodiphosphate synthase